VQRRRAGLLAAGLVALGGCAHTAGAPATGSATGDSEVIVSADLGSPDLLGVWSVYGLALASGAEKTGRDDYATEVTARSLLADSWKDLRAGKQLKDPYLDLLVEVRDAGFIDEYVLATLARPGWTLSGEELARLKLAPWTAWAATHLPADHRALTPVTVRLRGVRASAIAGADLPAGELDPSKAPCATLQPAMDRAVAAWERQAAALRGAPLSIQLPSQTVPVLERLAGDPRVRRDGVVFVAPTAFEVMFAAGFCAVDRGDWRAAETMLRRAVELWPADANARGELVQSLIMQKRSDEADAQLDVALAFADSDCRRAILWRKRGYILFDRGKLVDAYRAYARSLELDPQSDLARSEMNLIVTTLRRAGSYDEKALAPLVAPATGKLPVTNCPR